MIATKASLAVVVLLLLLGNAVSRPLHRSDEAVARNDLDSGFAKEVSTSLSLNGDDEWTKSNLLSKRDTTSPLVPGATGVQADGVSVGFDFDRFGESVALFLNTVLRLVTFSWN